MMMGVLSPRADCAIFQNEAKQYGKRSFLHFSNWRYHPRKHSHQQLAKVISEQLK